MIIDQKKLDQITDSQPLYFEDALWMLRVGKKVRRLDWHSGRFILLNKQMSIPGYEPRFTDQKDMRYEIKTEDILSEDWMLV